MARYAGLIRVVLDQLCENQPKPWSIQPVVGPIERRQNCTPADAILVSEEGDTYENNCDVLACKRNPREYALSRFVDQQFVDQQLANLPSKRGKINKQLQS